MEKKISTNSEVLCRGCPTEFASYLNYCKNLRFEDKPDYSYLKSQFRLVMNKMQLDFDFNWDWKDPQQKNKILL
jgi:casein kinase 1